MGLVQWLRDKLRGSASDTRIDEAHARNMAHIAALHEGIIVLEQRMRDGMQAAQFAFEETRCVGHRLNFLEHSLKQKGIL